MRDVKLVTLASDSPTDCNGHPALAADANVRTVTALRAKIDESVQDWCFL